MPANRVAVRRSRVAEVSAEAPLRQLLSRPPHQSVTRNFGHDRRRGNCCAEAVPAYNGALFIFEGGDFETVDKTDAAGASDTNQRFPQRCEIRFVQPTLVDATSAARNNYDALRRLHHDRQQRLPSRLIMLLRIVQRAQSAHLGHADRLEVEQNGGRDEWAGKAATARLIGAGNPT